MGLEQNANQSYREVVDKFIDPIISTQMTVQDQVVRPSASSAIVITLPPVADAKGKFYSIYARLASGSNTITIAHKSDSEGWTNITLDAANEGVLLYSDGVRWITCLVLSVDNVTLLGSIVDGAAQASRVLSSDAYKTTRIGGFNTSAALTLAVPFTTDLNFYTDGQLDIFSVFGGSGVNLTSAYSAKCGRFRHVVNGITCAHETYGLVGQVVAKNVTFAHLHAGLMGTFECNTACTVSAGDAVGCAAVIGRVGGATITIGATGFLAGIAAIQIATTVTVTTGGVFAAFACRKAGSGITWNEALHIEDALVAFRFKAADAGYAHGIKASTATPAGATTYAIAVKIGTEDGFIPVYAAESF
jgi:hypothetical protein